MDIARDVFMEPKSCYSRSSDLDQKMNEDDLFKFGGVFKHYISSNPNAPQVQIQSSRESKFPLHVHKRPGAPPTLLFLKGASELKVEQDKVNQLLAKLASFYVAKWQNKTNLNGSSSSLSLSDLWDMTYSTSIKGT
nr:hypothetical protein Iba_chr11fCG8560 [Ipomoea batatas]